MSQELNYSDLEDLFVQAAGNTTVTTVSVSVGVLLNRQVMFVNWWCERGGGIVAYFLYYFSTHYFVLVSPDPHIHSIY